MGQHGVFCTTLQTKLKAQNLFQIWNPKDHICGHLKKAITLFGSRGKEVVAHH
jgi:hypothetical protein